MGCVSNPTVEISAKNCALLSQRKRARSRDRRSLLLASRRRETIDRGARPPRRDAPDRSRIDRRRRERSGSILGDPLPGRFTDERVISARRFSISPVAALSQRTDRTRAFQKENGPRSVERGPFSVTKVDRDRSRHRFDQGQLGAVVHVSSELLKSGSGAHSGYGASGAGPPSKIECSR